MWFKFQAGTDQVQSTNPEKKRLLICNFNMTCLSFRPTKQHVWMTQHVSPENLNKALALLLQLGLGVIQAWWPTGGANASLDGRWRRVHYLSLNMYMHYTNPLQITKQLSLALLLKDPAWVSKHTCRKQLHTYSKIVYGRTLMMRSSRNSHFLRTLDHLTFSPLVLTLWFCVVFCICNIMFIVGEGDWILTCLQRAVKQ